MVSILTRLKEGGGDCKVSYPRYDFVSHSHKGEPHVVQECDVVLFEGIMALYDERLRSLMDMKIFVDTDADLRLARRSVFVCFFFHHKSMHRIIFLFCLV